MTDEVVASVMNLISDGKKVPEIANILNINKVLYLGFFSAVKNVMRNIHLSIKM